MKGSLRVTRCLKVVPVLIALASCVPVPMPAAKEVTRYDSLPLERPGQITGPELESRYGPPDLRCDNDSLWVYGWSVGHGAMMGVGIGGVFAGGRLYDTLHVAFLWLDSEQRLIRIEALAVSSDESGSKRPCASDGTCIQAQWAPWHAASDASWACGESFPIGIHTGLCSGQGLGPHSVVESNGRVLKCVWAGSEFLDSSGSPIGYERQTTPEPPSETPH